MAEQAPFVCSRCRLRRHKPLLELLAVVQAQETRVQTAGPPGFVLDTAVQIEI
jgi:hypothetical protein